PLPAGVFAQEDLVTFVPVSLPGNPKILAIARERGVVVLIGGIGDTGDRRRAVDLDGGAQREDTAFGWDVHRAEGEFALRNLDAQLGIGGRAEFDGHTHRLDGSRSRLRTLVGVHAGAERRPRVCGALPCVASNLGGASEVITLDALNAAARKRNR